MNIQHDLYGQLTRARVGRSLLALVLLCGRSDNTRNASGRREGGGSCRVFCEHSVPASSHGWRQPAGAAIVIWPDVESCDESESVAVQSLLTSIFVVAG